MQFSRNALFAAAAALVAASSGSAFAPTSTCEFPGGSHLRTMWNIQIDISRCELFLLSEIWDDCDVGDFSRISTR
jgi:hypothetical protein